MSKTERLSTVGQSMAPNIGGLAACIEDARLSWLDSEVGPPDTKDYTTLQAKLHAGFTHFSPLYQTDFVAPFLAAFDSLGEKKFNEVLISDSQLDGAGLVILDMAQAVTQRADKYQHAASNAFEEVVSDLYDGFLSAEDRRGIKPPDGTATPPLIKWGRPDYGPYTLPINATLTMGARAAVVSLPPANTRSGLLAWSALGHETSGHDILHANAGLAQELADAVDAAVNKAVPGLGLGEYWSSRIDETASDVMGILNMGPAAAIGLIGYFRGIGAATGGAAVLRTNGPGTDPHPADIVRGYLGAGTVELLSFSDRTAWSNVITNETTKDAAGKVILLDGTAVTAAQAQKSARAVATAIATTKAKALGGHSLSEIQDWHDEDESKIALIRPLLRAVGNISSLQQQKVYATHVVAAACIEALASGSSVKVVFMRMLAILDLFFDKNPSWGPLFVRHPGDLARDRFYVV